MLLPHTTRGYQISLLIVALLIFFSFYFALGSYPLLNNNEGLYAAIAKQMLLQKKFIIPHLNCVPYIEKPPLLYWLLALSFSLCGYSALAARLVTATSAALLCWAILYFTTKIKQPKIGISAILIFASSIGVSIIARMVYFDMLLTLLVSTTLCALFYWYETQKVGALRLSYALLALAILTKGLIAIILTWGSFATFLLLEKSFCYHMRRALDWPGILLGLAIVLPWHILAILHHKGFGWYYLIGEHFLRFLNLREPHDYYHGPLYYYLPRIIIYLFPWSAFLPLIFLRSPTITTAEKKLLRFSWCWLLIPLIFFSCASAKANYYMIVSMPALALILGYKLNWLINSTYYQIFNGVSALLLLILTLALLLGYLLLLPTYPEFILHKTLIAATIAYCLTATIISWFFIQNREVPLLLFASFIIPAVLTATTIIKTLNANLSAAAPGSYLATIIPQPVYLYQDFEDFSALAFYSNSCFTIIDSKSSDLAYGASLPQFKSQFITPTAFIHSHKPHPLYLIVPTKKLKEFMQKIPLPNLVTIRRDQNLTLLKQE